MTIIQIFGNYSHSSLRLCHLRFRSNKPLDTLEGVNAGVKQLTRVRNYFQDAGVTRRCRQRWSGMSLAGVRTSQLRLSLDFLYIIDEKTLSKLRALALRFTETNCTVFYCARGTKTNIQHRIGAFLRYPVWYVTTPFPEIEDYLKTDFFKTRLSRFDSLKPPT
jgi:hypothetical protein